MALSYAAILVVLLAACVLLTLGALLINARTRAVASVGLLLCGVLFLFFFSMRAVHVPHHAEDPGHPDPARMWPSDRGVIVVDSAHRNDTTEDVASDANDSAAARPPRPAWVDEPPQAVGRYYRTKAVSGPFATVEECHVALSAEMFRIANLHLDKMFGEGASRLVPLSPHELQTSIAREEFHETLNTSVGPMQQISVLLEFDNEALKARWEQALAERRLIQAAMGGLLLLGLVGAIFAYLKIDTATKGYYTGRLQAAAVVTILAIVLLGLSLA